MFICPLGFSLMFWCASQLAAVDFQKSDCSTQGKVYLVSQDGRSLATSTCCGIEYYHIYWYCSEYKANGRNLRDYLISDERASYYGSHKKHYEDMARELISEASISVNGTFLDRGISSSGHYTLGFDYTHQDYRMFLADGSVACFRYDYSKIGVCLTPFAYYYPGGCNLFAYPCDEPTQKLRLNLRRFLEVWDTTVPSMAISLPTYTEDIINNNSNLLPHDEEQIKPGYDCYIPESEYQQATTRLPAPNAHTRTPRTTVATTLPVRTTMATRTQVDFIPSSKEKVISLGKGESDPLENNTIGKDKFKPPHKVELNDE